tara:strand:- start:810 stop:1145 length:336 start_codon:yes stop_codon:yes gene_type:complete
MKRKNKKVQEILSRTHKTILYVTLHINELIEKGLLQEDVYKNAKKLELQKKKETKKQLKNFSPTGQELLDVCPYLLDLDNHSIQTRNILADQTWLDPMIDAMVKIMKDNHE